MTCAQVSRVCAAPSSSRGVGQTRAPSRPSPAGVGLREPATFFPPGPTSSPTKPMPTTTASRCTPSTRPPTARPAGCSSGEAPPTPAPGWPHQLRPSREGRRLSLWVPRACCVGGRARQGSPWGERNRVSEPQGWEGWALCGDSRAGLVLCGPCLGLPGVETWAVPHLSPHPRRRGTFYQGYLCTKCGVGAHKECLEVTPPCKISKYPPARPRCKPGGWSSGHTRHPQPRVLCSQPPLITPRRWLREHTLSCCGVPTGTAEEAEARRGGPLPWGTVMGLGPGFRARSPS